MNGVFWVSIIKVDGQYWAEYIIPATGSPRYFKAYLIAKQVVRNSRNRYKVVVKNSSCVKTLKRWDGKLTRKKFLLKNKEMIKVLAELDPIIEDTKFPHES